MRRAIRTVLMIGLAFAWRAHPAAGQYSWSTFSASLGYGTGGSGFSVGVSYAAADPWFDYQYYDPCWDYPVLRWVFVPLLFRLCTVPAVPAVRPDLDWLHAPLLLAVLLAVRIRIRLRLLFAQLRLLSAQLRIPHIVQLRVWI